MNSKKRSTLIDSVRRSGWSSNQASHSNQYLESKSLKIPSRENCKEYQRNGSRIMNSLWTSIWAKPWRLSIFRRKSDQMKIFLKLFWIWLIHNPSTSAS